MFRPDGDAHPDWRGNLKQYKFGYDVPTDTLFLAGADGNPAVSGASGFISPTTISYWTSPSTFWANEMMGTPPSASDSPDGEVVEKGGVAQQIRSSYATSQTGRNLFTCLSCSSGTNLSTNTTALFDTSNTSLTSKLDATTINWVRGTNNAGEIVPTTSPVTTIRPSVHGDILHSRPAVVNYGGATGVVVFYGSNDGLLRASTVTRRVQTQARNSGVSFQKSTSRSSSAYATIPLTSGCQRLSFSTSPRPASPCHATTSSMARSASTRR